MKIFYIFQKSDKKSSNDHFFVQNKTKILKIRLRFNFYIRSFGEKSVETANELREFNDFHTLGLLSYKSDLKIKDLYYI